MNQFPSFYGRYLLGWRRTLLVIMCVFVGSAAIAFALITAQDFRNAMLATASGARPSIAVTLPPGAFAEFEALAKKIAALPGVSACEPALRIEGDMKVKVQDEGEDVQFADVIPLELVGYSLAAGRPLPVALPEIYSKTSRRRAVGETPLDILSVSDPRDTGRAIGSDALFGRIFRRPMPSGDDFEIRLPQNGAKEGPVLHARTAGSYMVNAMASSANRVDPIYMRLDDLQKSTGLPGTVNSLDIRLADPARADSFLAQLRPLVPAATKMVTWQQKESESLMVMHFLETGVFVGILIVGGTAALSLCTLLFMVVTDKIREIALVSALGARPSLIGAMFLGIGIRIGLIGTLLGGFTGIGIAWCFSSRQAAVMANFYNRGDTPIAIPWGTLASAGAGILALCALAVLFPCRWSLRADPAKLLTHE